MSCLFAKQTIVFNNAALERDNPTSCAFLAGRSAKRLEIFWIRWGRGVRGDIPSAFLGRWIFVDVSAFCD